MIDKLKVTIASKEDIEKLNLEENSKINHLHLELRNTIDDKNLKLLFDKLSKSEAYNRFHLDLNEFKIDDDKVNLIINTIQKWDLREINFNFSNTTMTDEPYEDYTDLAKALGRFYSKEIHF